MGFWSKAKSATKGKAAATTRGASPPASAGPSEGQAMPEDAAYAVAPMPPPPSSPPVPSPKGATVPLREYERLQEEVKRKDDEIAELQQFLETEAERWNKDMNAAHERLNLEGFKFQLLMDMWILKTLDNAKLDKLPAVNEEEIAEEIETVVA